MIITVMMILFIIIVTGSDADDESDNKENTKERYQLNNYSIEFMQEVIDFADAKDSFGKRC